MRAIDIRFLSTCSHFWIKCAESIANRPGYIALNAPSRDAAAWKGEGYKLYKQAQPSATLASLRTLLSMLDLEYWLLSSTIFTTSYCLSSTIYLSLPAIAGKNEHCLVLFPGMSKHHLNLVDTCFTPTSSQVTSQS